MEEEKEEEEWDLLINHSLVAFIGLYDRDIAN